MAKRSFPSYRIYKDKAGEWRWSYEAKNGQQISKSSEGYVKRSDCAHSIDIMKNSSKDLVWDEEKEKDDA